MRCSLLCAGLNRSVICKLAAGILWPASMCIPCFVSRFVFYVLAKKLPDNIGACFTGRLGQGEVSCMLFMCVVS